MCNKYNLNTLLGSHINCPGVPITENTNNFTTFHEFKCSKCGHISKSINDEVIHGFDGNKFDCPECKKNGAIELIKR